MFDERGCHLHRRGMFACRFVTCSGLLKPKSTGSARTSLFRLLHLHSTITGIRTWEITSSSGPKRSWISGRSSS